MNQTPAFGTLTAYDLSDLPAKGRKVPLTSPDMLIGPPARMANGELLVVRFTAHGQASGSSGDPAEVSGITEPPPLSVTADLTDPASARNASIALGCGDAVPVPVLEALASAWEDQAERGRVREGGTRYTDEGTPTEATTLADCARMLREAIAHGGQG